ncbi:MAG: hypothetical protein ABEJ57_03245 [Halobacteriaceae archaeon]
MQRRHLIASLFIVGLALLAGCSAAGSIGMRPVNDTVLADRASRSTQPAEPDEPQPWAVAAAAIENGSTTVEATAPPITDGLPFQHDGRYYTLSQTIVATHTETRVSVTVDYNATNTTGDAIAFGELPPVDRALLDSVLPAAEDISLTQGPEMGVGARYTAAELNASVLAPVQQYQIVTFQGARYRIDLDGTEAVTVHTYRYHATRVGSNASTYADYLRRHYAFTITDLSEAQRSVIQTAAEDGSYYAESTDDAAFDAVVDLFLAHEAITRDAGTGLWLVRYRGQYYLVDLRFGRFVETRSSRLTSASPGL